MAAIAHLVVSVPPQLLLHWRTQLFHALKKNLTLTLSDFFSQMLFSSDDVISFPLRSRIKWWNMVFEDRARGSNCPSATSR